MKQATFIIISIIMVLALVALWIYLLFFNTKSPSNIFADLGFEGEKDTNIAIPTASTEPEPIVNINRPQLRQLTTKPVIGFVEVQATSTNPVVIRFAEAGNGHVHQIDLSSGTETRLSMVTNAAASEAVFSPDGSLVAQRSRNDRVAGELTLIRLPDGSDQQNIGSSTRLEEPIQDFTVFSSTTIGYTTRTASGLKAFEYSLVTSKSDPLFTIPFYSVIINWGSSTRSSHIVYPKTSYALEGYLYSFTKGTMSRLPASGYGFSAINTDRYIIYNRTSNYLPKTYVYDKQERSETELALVILPEKCATDPKQSLFIWCAAEDTTLPLEFPDHWYTGELSFNDTLWQINLETKTIALVSDIKKESGRELDIVKPAFGVSGTALYFINKNDSTLWMYEI